MINHGELTVTVWPAFIGLAEAGIREPLGHFDYNRGQIAWETHKNKTILGHGRIYIPKGTFLFVVFANSPTKEIIGLKPLEHPIVFDRSGFVDIDHIRNQDILPRGS